MPPKRKRTDDPIAEAAPTRATRSSARKTAPSEASTSRSAAKTAKEGSGEQPEAGVPPTKKTKTTKATAKTTTAATNNTKTTSVKKSTTSSSKAYFLSTPPLHQDAITGTLNAARMGFLSSLCCAHNVKTVYSDDDVIVQKKGSIAESQTPTTINEPPPIPARVKPPPARLPVNEPYSAARAQALFKDYEDSDEPNTIGSEGFARLCNDAEIAMDGPLPLILAWQLGTKEMMKITADEWSKGTESLKISNLPALTLAVSDLEDVLVLNKAIPTQRAKKDVYDKTTYWKYCQDKKASFNQLYMFCFALVKPEHSKNIDMETATALWSVLLTPQYPLMGEVIGFIGDNPTVYKAANKDLWSMMLEFCQTVNPNLSDYEGDGAWPTLLDTFVAWKKGSIE
ncbi:hypothetical protein DXG01_013273 [Tephrocybe rancida]|nr:hypothetical protein DXG01_013273 [Tephrocybe rancida]